MRRSVGILLTAIFLIGAGCGRSFSTGSGDASQARTASPVTTPSGTPETTPVCGTAAQPAPRQGMAFVYLPNLGEGLLFGGAGSGHQRLNDTWVWQSGCWAPHSPQHMPSARTEAAATFDVNSHKALLYGGSGCASYCFDTWTWDGRDWTQIASSGPQLIGKPVAGFDPVTRSVVLFGWGPDGSQTWTWSGNAWLQLSPATSPEARAAASLTLDPTRGRLLLFGGRGGIGIGALNDTWVWDGKTWNLLAPTNRPPARSEAAMAGWTARNYVVLVGGLAPGVGDAWKWDGSDWSQIASIGVRAGAVAIDVGPRILVFGGADGNDVLSDTEAWDGGSWSKV
jgi:galactose oxidase-like protein